MAKALRVLEIAVYIFLIIFSVFIIYQLVLKILGGSWETQDIIVALVVLLLGLVFNITIKQVKFEARFNYMANDFRNHIRQHNSKLI
ncbi:MAG: hypothetical protein KKE50_05055 [Nanoarchaeota archaeon]|nr:hypothetical protein [Nanoarchaeota archaeon]